ncbi:MAG: HD domain-containing protein [Lachnospira sp.]|nr:HD domain-containing protein [Lachnospira sp.]
MNDNEELIQAMIDYDTGMPKQIQHFLKVYEFAHLIAIGEKLPEDIRRTLETAAIVHDIGIRNSLKIYGDSDGKHQEQLGPAEARTLLVRLGYPQEQIQRVEFLIGHHHTYSHIEGDDYQILVEADFLVNLYEDQELEQAAERVREKIFRTKTGKDICTRMFGLKPET